jgi:hypothetical protein
MYIWKGKHQVGYINYIITSLKVTTVQKQNKKKSCKGTIVLADRPRKPGDIYSWNAFGIIQLDKTVLWTIHCTDKTADCNELSGEPAFTGAADINDDIRAFISNQLPAALLHFNKK